MKTIRIIILTAMVGLLTACGGKDDALFLFPFAGEVTADQAAAPGVPDSDLQTGSTGNASGDGTVTEVTGDSATPPTTGGSTNGSGDSGSTNATGDNGSTSGSGDSGSTNAAGDNGSTSGSGDSGSTGSTNAAGDNGSTSGSGDSGSTGSTNAAGDNGSTSGSGDSGSTGSTNAAGDNGSTSGSGDSGSTGSTNAAGDNGSTSGSGDSGSTGSNGTTTNAGGDSGSTGGTANTVTSGTKVGSDYSHLDGTWYKDGTTMFTYQQDKAIGYTFANLQEGRYRVTINAKHWVKHDSTQNLPDGYTNFNVSIAGSGGAQTTNIAASSTAFKAGSVELDLAEGSNQLLLNFLNPSCGSEGGFSDVGKKTAICHIPPGNPSAQHTITVGSGAVNAHLKHGDKLGSCSVCTSLQIGSISIERVGDASSGMTAFLQNARNNRSVLIATIVLAIAIAGLLGIQRWRRRTT